MPRGTPASEHVGKKFHHLKIIGTTPSTHASRNGLMLVCECDCGKICFNRAQPVVQGAIKSCGCMRSTFVSAGTKKHGASKTREYATYRQAKRRCEDPRAPKYHNYGGRGIEFRFKSFEEFIEHLGTRPPGNHISLDRIDNDGHYEPGNVRWTTMDVQGVNRRDNKRVTYQGKTMTISQWERHMGMPFGRLRQRLSKGLDLDTAFSPGILPRPTTYKKKTAA